MALTLLLSLIGCILQLLMILALTLTMPTEKHTADFPADLQDTRHEQSNKHSFTPHGLLGLMILVLYCFSYVALFVIGGVDGVRRSYTFLQFFLRFFVIAGIIKIFDAVRLGDVLLKKTHFFRHHFS